MTSTTSLMFGKRSSVIISADAAFIIEHKHSRVSIGKMMRPFQVNVGSYIALNTDIPPTSRVSELCSLIEAFSGEKADSQVLLTADGRQMNPHDIIGNYSVGTDDKPIFVFYRSYLGNTESPPTFSKIPQKGGGLQKKLEILKQRPSLSLFQHQVALAKRLCEYSLEMGHICSLLSEEFGLQFSGWETVLSNCNNIIGLFQKHHQVFCTAVEKFKADKPRYTDLLQQFPQQVKLLQQLPIPSSIQNSGSSLYDWISTHDEKNSLMDLSMECQKALLQVNSEQIEVALQSSVEINGTRSEILDAKSRDFLSKRDKIRSEIEEAREIMETVKGLNKNIQLTSDKAFRSGDAKTMTVLVESHHNSLQIINKYSTRLGTIARGAEEAKRELTCHIHSSLKQVMLLQKKVADSNGQLVLLHEHIKLARKRFEILEQVCSTPQVLVEVVSEVERRRSYNAALEKVMDGTSSRLREARETEKRLRTLFQSTHGIHFVTTLFPELQDRVPDITFHAPKSLRKKHDESLENIRTLLPQDLRPLSQSTESVKLLTQIFLNPTETQHNNSLPADSLKDPSLQGHNSLARDQTDLENLKEIVGKLELKNLELSSRLHQNTQITKTLEGECSEKESAYLSANQKLGEYEKLVSSLQHKVHTLEFSKESLDNERQQFSERVENLDQINRESIKKQEEMSEDILKLAQERAEMNVLCSRLKTEKDSSLSKLKDMIEKLEDEHAQFVTRLENNCARLQEELTQSEINREKDLQTLSAKSNSEKTVLEDSIKDLQTQVGVLESKLCEVQDSHKIEQQRLEDELSRSLLEVRIQKEELLSTSGDLTVTRNELEERVRALKQCLKELDVVKKERREAQDYIKGLKEEYSRQQEQAEATINVYKEKLEFVDSERKNILAKMDEKEHDRKELENMLNQKEPTVIDLEKKLKSAEEQIGGLESDLSKKKELEGRLQQSEQELNISRNELQRKVDELLVIKEEKCQIKDELECGLQVRQAKLEKTVREHEDKKNEWSHERDHWIRQVMELERELKELRRETGQESPPTVSPGKQISRKRSSSATLMSDSTVSPESLELPKSVVVQGLQIGQVGLFMSDQYGNYLALSLDGRTYYLDSDCIPNLHDIGSKMPQLNLRRRILIGKISGRLYMEVRKESNRLKVPVGSRLYKVKADEVNIT